MSIFTNIWAWIKKAEEWVAEDAAKTAVAIVEELQTIWKSGAPAAIADVLDKLTKSGVPTAIVNAIGAALPKILTDALLIEQGLPANPTAAQIATFEQAALAAWGIIDNKSKIYTTVGADIVAIINANTQPGVVFNWITFADQLEAAYQDYFNVSGAGDNTAS